MSASRSVLVTVCLLVCAGSAVFLWRGCSHRSPEFRSNDWFYDLNTGQLFAGPREALPPIDAPSGPLPDGTPAGVRAHVFGCGSCAEADRTIAWLEAYSPDQRELITPPEPAPKPGEPVKPFMPAFQVQPLVKRVGDETWVGRDTPEGAALIADALPKCTGGIAPQECSP